jgi:hypothetical protein
MRMLAVAFLALPAMAAAQDVTDAATGAVYQTEVQGDGTVRLSYNGEEDVYVLQSDCFATHMIYGVGMWKTDAEGWQVQFGGATILNFPGGPVPFEGVDCSRGPQSGG